MSLNPIESKLGHFFFVVFADILGKNIFVRHERNMKFRNWLIYGRLKLSRRMATSGATGAADHPNFFVHHIHFGQATLRTKIIQLHSVSWQLQCRGHTDPTPSVINVQKAQWLRSFENLPRFKNGTEVAFKNVF